MTFIEVINWSAKDSVEAPVIASDKNKRCTFRAGWQALFDIYFCIKAAEQLLCLYYRCGLRSVLCVKEVA
jgi:hypothetical protein